MKQGRFTKLLIVGLCIGLVLFIYFQGRNKSTALVNKNPVSPENLKQDFQTGSFDFEGYKREFIKGLPKNSSTELVSNLQKLDANKNDSAQLRVVSKLFDKAENPTLAGYYLESIAKQSPNNYYVWQQLGIRYFEAQGFFSGTPSYDYFVAKSIEAFEKALKLNPLDYESKSNLAANYIEGKQETMKGVGLLKEILQSDSNNQKAIMYLGFLSIQSGQIPKAILRFERLVTLNPQNSDYHRFLGEAYLKAGKNKEGKRELETYKTMVRDPRLLAQVNKMLSQVK